jgi:hypothetical protein
MPGWFPSFGQRARQGKPPLKQPKAKKVKWSRKEQQAMKRKKEGGQGL